MQWLKFSVAVIATSVVLIGAGVFVAGQAFASAAPPALVFAQAMGQGGPGGPGFRGGPGASWNLPPQLAGLKDIPADQRFDHFLNVQVNLTDRDGKPVAVSIVAGKATAVSATSLTIAGNDGASHTYTLDSQTMTHGQTFTSGQDLAVITINGSTTATGVFAPIDNWGGPNGGPWHR
jgi:hypothetical protein